MLRSALLLLALSWAGMSTAAPVQTDHVEAELVAERTHLQTGEVDNWIALRLRPDPGWHVYWENPGDSGIATRLEWRLPEGVSAGPMQWPYPEPHSLGELTNYGYGAETLHLIPLRVRSAGPVRLEATAKWLVCKDICIPGEAALSLDLDARDTPPPLDAAWRGAFDGARARLPQAWPGGARYAVDAQDFSLALDAATVAADATVAFFALPNDLVAHAAPQRVQRDADQTLRLSQKLSPYFVAAPDPVRGVLVVHAQERTQAYAISAARGEVAVVPDVPGSATKDAAHTNAPAEAAASLLPMLGFALLGGLILNLMPCVFPILAMKALSLLHAGGASAPDNRRHALAYTAGVVLSFLLVASVLIGLRAGGAALGWGFQLQSPGFVFALAAVIFAMGLALSGVVQVGSAWMGAGQRLAQRPGLDGSFFTGVLAVVVASPCTAPFMAPALGFALTQSAPAALSVFAALGLGLALPFLVLGFVPRVAAWLPRPGAWMETLKQFLAFPMYLTAAWLLWVLGGLSGRDAMGLALAALVVVALALWGWGRARGLAGRGLALLLLIAAGSVALHPALREAPAGHATVTSAWEPYSDARFDELRAQGRSVFVDFTADWCLTCKLNERGALRAARVREAFREHDVALLVGDWTRADPAITAVLDRYGRSGVPLYLVSRKGDEPRVLPQILTPEIIVSAFE